MATSPYTGLPVVQDFSGSAVPGPWPQYNENIGGLEISMSPFKHIEGTWLHQGDAPVPFGAAVGTAQQFFRGGLLGPDTVPDTLDIGAGDSGTRWTTRRDGLTVKVELIDPNAEGDLAIAVTGSGTAADPHIISVTLANDAGPAIITTAQDLQDAIDADPSAGGLVSVEQLGAGTGIVAEFALAALAPDWTDLDFVGIARLNAQSRGYLERSYNAGDMMEVFRAGIVSVLCEEDITSHNDPVRVRFRESGLKLPGRFGKTAEAGYTAVLDGAQWFSPTAINSRGERIGGLYLWPTVHHLTMD